MHVELSLVYHPIVPGQIAWSKSGLSWNSWIEKLVRWPNNHFSSKRVCEDVKRVVKTQKRVVKTLKCFVKT